MSQMNDGVATASFELTPEQEAKRQQALSDAAAAAQKSAEASKNGFGAQGAIDGYKAKKEYDEANRQASNAVVDAQAQNAGVQRADTQGNAGGIEGFFGGKQTVSQYTAGNVADTTTAGNKAAIAGQMDAIKNRQAVTSQAASSQAAGIDQSQQGQFRGGQLSLAQTLQQSAAGNGPSAAQAQLQAGTDASIAQSLALARSGRAGNQSVALKQALMQGGQATQQAANQAAQLKAQEQQAATGQLAGVLDASRNADIGLATSQAGLTQQNNLANAANQQQTNLANQASTVQQQQANDASIAQLMAQGFTLDQAQQQTQIQQQQFNAGLLAQQEAAKMGISSQNAASAAQVGGSFIGGVASLASDRRAKTKIVDGDGEVRAFLDQLMPKGFEYKDAKFGSGHHLGVMAQDVEKGAPDIVIDDTDGVKKLDMRKALSASLASLGSLNKRLNKLESKRG